MKPDRSRRRKEAEKSAQIRGFIRLLLLLPLLCVPFTRASAATNIARLWNEQTLAAIRIDAPNPPVHARNLFHLSAAMYDAWAAYDPIAAGYLYHRKHTATDLSAARNEAISYAAYRILSERYALSKSATSTLALLDSQFAALGFDKNNESTNTSAPAGVGNLVAATIAAFFINDGSLQTRFYIDYPTNQGGYAPVNPPLDVIRGYPFATNVNYWQPLYITNATAQNGFPAATTQSFLGSQWLGARPFALTRTDSNSPWFDPGPPPHLGGFGDAQFRSELVDLLQKSSQLSPDLPATLDISPGSFGNNTLGVNDGHGRSLNPFTSQPYATEIVKIGDFARVLAEFWADGPNSETPPGHWNVIANKVSDNPSFSKRLGGVGPVLDDLEWDVKIYFAINAALHDAACAAWSLKRVYNGWRPVEAIRYMANRGQCSDPATPHYHPEGLPLITNLIELVTTNTAVSGGRHAGLPVGAIALYVWPGQPVDFNNQYSGVHWIAGTNWFPYQRETFVTPAFPGYVSGHSTFSRAAAEVLAAITGSPFFPGGLSTYTNLPLIFEKGPSQSFTLQWATYFDAADQAGLSRLWGGIHVSVDDLAGRMVGSRCGQSAWTLARQYFDGSILSAPFVVSVTTSNNSLTLQFDSVRGLLYQVQSTPTLMEPFVDNPGGFFQATDSPTRQFITNPPSIIFYRLARVGGP
jgi:hypothetical protein